MTTRGPTAQQVMEAPELLNEDRLRILHRYAQELERENQELALMVSRLTVALAHRENRIEALS